MAKYFSYLVNWVLASYTFLYICEFPYVLAWQNSLLVWWNQYAMLKIISTRASAWYLKPVKTNSMLRPDRNISFAKIRRKQPLSKIWKKPKVEAVIPSFRKVATWHFLLKQDFLGIIEASIVGISFHIYVPNPV